MVREKARLQPDAPAVEDGDRIVSFRELDGQSDQVAAELIKRGLRMEEPVAVMMPMSAEFLTGILGVMKAGGCYFPIDPETPEKRLAFLLANSQTRFLWSDSSSVRPLKDWPGTILDLAQTLPAASDNSAKVPVVPSHPQRLAYLLYTSGSTGQPKGVQIEHHSLTNFIFYCLRRFHLTPADRSSLLAYTSFDVSVCDIWPTLCAGGTVVVPPQGILKDPDRLIAWLKSREITFSFVPTGLVEILFTRPWPDQMKLRYLITGGDRLRLRPPAGLTFPVINGYGPTESTVFSTMAVVHPENGGAPPPIGVPLDNVTAYVVDEKLERLPIGAAGELYLGGEQVARGYLYRPELTQERFIPDPFIGRPGARMYRTGDWARWLPNGELDFIGRKDDQIQIRGNRVELGEIEAFLFAHETVKQVCCVPRLVDGMPTSVVAHIVTKNGCPDPAEQLREYLSRELPDYMVPSRFIFHDRLPLTPQGKVDRAAMMARLEKEREPAPGIHAEGGLAQALSALWRSLLPAAANSPADMTFAQLGGDSLLLVKLMLSVKDIMGCQIEASAFLVQPTFNGLCQTVIAQMAQIAFQPILTLHKSGNRPPLFFMYGLSGDIEKYFALAEALGKDQPLYGIRSPALNNESLLPGSMEAAAEEAAGFIRKIQPQSAPALVGFSWAGQLAFAVSEYLARKENLHCFTVLIGTEAPKRPVGTIQRSVHFVRYLPQCAWDLARDSARRRRLVNLLRKPSKINPPANGHDSDIPDWAATPITRHLYSLSQKYCPTSRPDVALEILRERADYSPHPHPNRPLDTNYLPDGGWSRWTKGEVRVHWIDGDHFSILQPPLVTDLARAIRSAHDRYLKKITTS